MASTFDIGGGPRNNKNLVSDCPGGGGCTVTLSGPWTIGADVFLLPDLMTGESVSWWGGCLKWMSGSSEVFGRV